MVRCCLINGINIFVNTKLLNYLLYYIDFINSSYILINLWFGNTHWSGCVMMGAYLANPC